MKTNERPTPETDRAEAVCEYNGYISFCVFEFVRRLEQERDEAQEENASMREAIKEAFSSFADEPESDAAWLLNDRQREALTKLRSFTTPTE